MALFVEDTEIIITEKTVNEDVTHEIGDNFCIQEVVEKTIYRSTIFSYDDGLSVMVSKQKRFGELYYKIVLFSDAKCIAWQLLVLSASLDTKVRRLNEEMFLITALSEDQSVVSQISFCKIKPSGKVDEITLNFSKLVDLQFINDDILICLEEKDPINNNTLHLLSLYNAEGKQLKNYYEYYDSDEEKFTYELKDNDIQIIKLNK